MVGLSGEYSRETVDWLKRHELSEILGDGLDHVLHGREWTEE